MTAEINVEEIMKELKEKAAKRKIEQEEDSFEQMTADSVCEELSYWEAFDRENFIFELTEINRYFWVNPEVTIEEKGFLKRTIKKTIQKMVRFTIYPLVEKQNEFNQVATRALNQIRNYIATHDNVDKRLEELQFIIEKEILKPMHLYSEAYQKMRAKYEKFTAKIEKYEEQEKQNKKRIALLEHQIELLEKELQIQSQIKNRIGEEQSK